MQKALVLTDSQKNFLSKLSGEQKPNESCAILYGRVEGEKILITEIFATENIEKSPVNFTISNEELIKAYQIAEEKNLDVVGIFHSHPDSEAYPSNTDKKFMYTNPVVWLIYSGIMDYFKAFVLESDLIEIPIVAN